MRMLRWTLKAIKKDKMEIMKKLDEILIDK